MTEPLILKRGSASRSQRRDDDYDVLENGVVVGRIFCLDAVGPWPPLDVGERPLGGHSQARTTRLRGDARGCDGGVRQSWRLEQDDRAGAITDVDAHLRRPNDRDRRFRCSLTEADTEGLFTSIGKYVIIFQCIEGVPTKSFSLLGATIWASSQSKLVKMTNGEKVDTVKKVVFASSDFARCTRVQSGAGISSP